MEIQNDLSKLKNISLLERTDRLVREERRIGIEILWHFREIESRRAYVESGCTSLFEYATKVLKYSEAAAYRRISAMRVLRENPEASQMVRQGSLSVTTISQIEGFLKFEKIQNKKVYTFEEKRDLLVRVQDKSTRQVERELIAESVRVAEEIRETHPDVIVKEWVVAHEKARAVGPKHTEITFVAEEVLCQKLQRARGLLAAKLGRDGSYAGLIDQLAEIALDKIDPMRRIQRSEKRALQKVERRGVSSAA